MFTLSSNFSNNVDSVFLYIVILSLIVLVGITVAMIYFVIRYSRKRNPVPKQIEGNLTLEILWTAIPLALFLSMFYFGWIGYEQMRAIPDDAIPFVSTCALFTDFAMSKEQTVRTDQAIIVNGHYDFR